MSLRHSGCVRTRRAVACAESCWTARPVAVAELFPLGPTAMLFGKPRGETRVTEILGFGISLFVMFVVTFALLQSSRVAQLLDGVGQRALWVVLHLALSVGGGFAAQLLFLALLFALCRKSRNRI